MNKLNEVDKVILKYHRIPHIVEAYKIFYGEYPIFNNIELEYKKIQLMMTILTEYNIEGIRQLEIGPKDFEYNEFKKMPFSYELYKKCQILENKIKDVSNLESELGQLCKEKPLSESAKRDIRIISSTIKQQLEKEEAEDPIEFLLQLCNILCFRKYAILTYTGSYEEQVNEMEDDLEKDFKNIEHEQNDTKEKINFIVTGLRLGLKPGFGECSTEVMIMYNNISDEILYDDSYTGLLSKENNKVLTK